MMLFGTTTKLPALVRSLVARQVISATRPSKSPTLIQWPTLNGRSLWIARPAKALPSGVLEREAHHHGPTADVVSSWSWKDEGRNDQQHADDDRVLDDRRERDRARGRRRSGLISEMTSRLISAAVSAEALERPRGRCEVGAPRLRAQAGPEHDDGAAM